MAYDKQALRKPGLTKKQQAESAIGNTAAAVAKKATKKAKRVAPKTTEWVQKLGSA
jgi:hypothetical protein